ncbi:unnamed protein product [Toxocara canis]|uniref:AKTx n=1 Tax=Toxocara canis TaxID=6265 RepID=A0A183V703_TOXCA|nr:unnamed protein product [Toxocara canis]
MPAIIVLVMMMLLVCTNAAMDFSACASMNIPGLSKVAQALCNNSCKLQNCPKAKCEIIKGRKTCVCSYCSLAGRE